MACFPPGTLKSGSSDWLAWGYVDWYLTGYNAEGCSYPGVQMHEIGHNINFAHSGMGNDEYGDLSCMVSYINHDIAGTYQSMKTVTAQPITLVFRLSRPADGKFRG